jgi:hypothetical protein
LKRTAFFSRAEKEMNVSLDTLLQTYETFLRKRALRALQGKEYYQANREAIKPIANERAKLYYELHREEVLAKKKAKREKMKIELKGKN